MIFSCPCKTHSWGGVTQRSSPSPQQLSELLSGPGAASHLVWTVHFASVNLRLTTHHSHLKALPSLQKENWPCCSFSSLYCTFRVNSYLLTICSPTRSPCSWSQSTEVLHNHVRTAWIWIWNSPNISSPLPDKLLSCLLILFFWYTYLHSHHPDWSPVNRNFTVKAPNA